MKIVIFTRTGFHHTCFINRLQERFEIACVVRESYPENHRKENVLITVLKNLFRQDGINRIKDNLFLKRFYEMYSAGFRYHPILKDYLNVPFDLTIEKAGTKYLNIKCGEINSSDFALFLKDIKPDIIAVLGSSIIRPHIISMPSIAIINLHSGLSPYYRGTWSHGWPIVKSEPEYIGVTVHLVDSDIDSGDIIFQTRPRLEGHDDLNSIFLKLISEGIDLVIKAIEDIQRSGTIKSYKQPRNTGRLYLSGDFSADTARLCITNLQNGIIEKYNSNKKDLDSRALLYGYVPPSIFK